MRTRGRLNGEGGFTLVEMLVVVMLMVLIVVAIGSLIRSGIKSSSANYNAVKIGEAGDEAVNVMTRQIRGAVAISPNSSASDLIFAADVNADKISDTVRFNAANGFLRTGTCRLSAGLPAMQDWIEGCDGVTFIYWTIDAISKKLVRIEPGSSEWSDGGNSLVVRIDFELRLSRELVDEHTLDRTFTGSVSLRNTLADMF